jgi:hypothetical protein
MLSLDDERWSLLTTFFGEPESVPKVIREWIQSIGTDNEDTIYERDLFDLFLHQVTIASVAFAIVPWLVHVCKQGNTRLRVEYLTDIALVEANRLKYGVFFHNGDPEPCPQWLMTDYHLAIVETRYLVDDVIKADGDSEEKRGLIAVKPALYGDADLAWFQWSGSRP